MSLNRNSLSARSLIEQVFSSALCSSISCAGRHWLFRYGYSLLPKLYNLPHAMSLIMSFLTQSSILSYHSPGTCRSRSCGHDYLECHQRCTSHPSPRPLHGTDDHWAPTVVNSIIDHKLSTPDMMALLPTDILHCTLLNYQTRCVSDPFAKICIYHHGCSMCWLSCYVKGLGLIFMKLAILP